jgi:hypothetical protein
MDEAEQKIIQDLILEGALQFAGIDDDTGEMLYTFSDKIKTVMPALYDEHISSVNQEIMYLWEKGYLEIDLLLDNPSVILTNNALNPEEILKLSPDKQRSLNEIKRILML